MAIKSWLSSKTEGAELKIKFIPGNNLEAPYEDSTATKKKDGKWEVDVTDSTVVELFPSTAHPEELWELFALPGEKDFWAVLNPNDACAAFGQPVAAATAPATEVRATQHRINRCGPPGCSPVYMYDILASRWTQLTNFARFFSLAGHHGRSTRRRTRHPGETGAS